MTSSVDQTGVALIQSFNSTTQTSFVPAMALFVALVASHAAGASLTLDSVRDRSDTSSLTSQNVRRSIEQELLDFHRRLAESQTDLPEDAARVLRENLWLLYD